MMNNFLLKRVLIFVGIVKIILPINIYAVQPKDIIQLLDAKETIENQAISDITTIHKTCDEGTKKVTKEKDILSRWIEGDEQEIQSLREQILPYLEQLQSRKLDFNFTMLQESVEQVLGDYKIRKDKHLFQELPLELKKMLSLIILFFQNALAENNFPYQDTIDYIARYQMIVSCTQDKGIVDYHVFGLDNDMCDPEVIEETIKKTRLRIERVNSFLLIPSYRPLSVRDINQLRHTGILPVGLSSEMTSFDGHVEPVIGFMVHDLQHALEINNGERIVYREKGALEFSKKMELRKRDSQFEQDLNQKLKNIADQSEMEIFDVFSFFLTHEFLPTHVYQGNLKYMGAGAHMSMLPIPFNREELKERIDSLDINTFLSEILIRSLDDDDLYSAYSDKATNDQLNELKNEFRDHQNRLNYKPSKSMSSVSPIGSFYSYLEYGKLSFEAKDQLNNDNEKIQNELEKLEPTKKLFLSLRDKFKDLFVNKYIKTINEES